jgi:hypothetical protein
MRPDGGARENTFIDGSGAILGGLAVDLLGLSSMKSIEKSGEAELRLRRRVHTQRVRQDPRNSPSKRIQKSMKARLISERAIARHKIEIGSATRLLKGISFAYLGIFAAQMAESVATPGLTPYAQSAEMEQPTFLDTNQAYTQRQRALQAIHESQLGIRNVIGNEAALFHK